MYFIRVTGVEFSRRILSITTLHRECYNSPPRESSETSSPPLRPSWLLGGPLFYQTSTTNIVMIPPSIFMSALFVCLTHDHHDICWTHCTSWGSCWWSFSCFSLLESSIQKDHAKLTPLSRWFCNPLIKNPMVEPQCSKHGWAAFALPLPLQEVT